MFLPEQRLIHIRRPLNINQFLHIVTTSKTITWITSMLVNSSGKVVSHASIKYGVMLVSQYVNARLAIKNHYRTFARRDPSILRIARRASVEISNSIFGDCHVGLITFGHPRNGFNRANQSFPLSPSSSLIETQATISPISKRSSSSHWRNDG